MDVYFAIDIGGTQLRAGLYPADSTKPIAMKKISTRGKESAVDRLIGLISELWPGEGTTVRGIGADAPGPLDSNTGVIYEAPNIPAWKNLPLSEPESGRRPHLSRIRSTMASLTLTLTKRESVISGLSAIEVTQR